MFTKKNEDMPEVTTIFNGGDERSSRDIVITPDMVKLKTGKLKRDKAPGDDEITPKDKAVEYSRLRPLVRSLAAPPGDSW